MRKPPIRNAHICPCDSAGYQNELLCTNSQTDYKWFWWVRGPAATQAQDRLPNFLRYGAPCARGAALKTLNSFLTALVKIGPCCPMFEKFVKNCVTSDRHQIWPKGSRQLKPITGLVSVPNRWYASRNDVLKTHKNGGRRGPGGRTELGYFCGGYVPPGTPNWHPVLKKISPKIDTPF